MLAREAFNDPQTIGNPRDLTLESYERDLSPRARTVNLRQLIDEAAR